MSLKHTNPVRRTSHHVVAVEVFFGFILFLFLGALEHTAIVGKGQKVEEREIQI